LADVAHEEGDFENEICSGAVLFGFPVDLEQETQGVWVGNFVGCGQPRPQRGVARRQIQGAAMSVSAARKMRRRWSSAAICVQFQLRAPPVVGRGDVVVWRL
jgi:hypothetical protein